MSGEASGYQQDLFVEHELVDKLVAEPESAANCIALYGLVGRSEDPARIRLYGSPHLDSNFEILKEDVLHRKDVPEGRIFKATGTTILWVRRDSALGVRRRDAQEIRAGLLQGALERSWMPRSEEPDVSAQPVAAQIPEIFQRPTETWICTCNSGCATQVCF